MEDVKNSAIESYKTEKEVLLAWTKIINEENPDIIIGYNIFGFDYDFMFQRAKENKCVREFSKCRVIWVKYVVMKQIKVAGN